MSSKDHFNPLCLSSGTSKVLCLVASGQTWLSTLVPACLSLPLPVSLPWSSCLWPCFNLLGSLNLPHRVSLWTFSHVLLSFFLLDHPYFQDSVSLMKLVCAGALGLSSPDSSLVGTGTLGVTFHSGAHLGQGLCPQATPSSGISLRPATGQSLSLVLHIGTVLCFFPVYLWRDSGPRDLVPLSKVS